MLIFKTDIDFFSEKPQARRASLVELKSFVFNFTTGTSVNGCGFRPAFVLVETQIAKLSGEIKNWKKATLQVFNFFAFAIQPDAPHQYILQEWLKVAGKW